MKTTLTIQGMHCHSCKVLLEDVCRERAGVISCCVDFDTGKAIIEHDEPVDWATLKKEIESLGAYHVDGPHQ